MKKLVNSIKVLFRGTKEMCVLSPSLSASVLIGASISGALPFINIYFTAAILDVLSTTKYQKMLIIYISFSLCLNFILFTLSNIFQRITFNGFNILYNNEKKNISKKLFAIDYEMLESTHFQEMVTKHKSSINQNGGAFSNLAWVLMSLISGFVTIGFCIAFLLPLFRSIFVRTGDSFMETQWFGPTVILAIVFTILIILIMSSGANKKYYKLNDNYLEISRIFEYYVEMLTNYNTGKEIRIFKEHDLIERHATNEMINKGVDIQKKMAALIAKSSGLIAIIGAVISCGVYLIIGIKGLAGLFTVGSIIRYTGGFLQLIQGLTNVAMNIGKLSSVIPGFSYYFDIMDTEDSHVINERKLSLSKKENIIEFRNVSFKYPGTENYALRNISFNFCAGERFAIVGENGSGKTTFIKLLCRMYDVQDGEILINGVNIKEYDKQEYRKLFSIVFQDFKIFSFPLGQNIAASVEYDADCVESCIEEVGLKRRLERMPQNLDTYMYKDCDSDGVEISGGEAQKIALARALYKDAPFIVLDEPTAALDPIAEFEMYSKFGNLVGDKAAIYISHRLSSCRFCSKIAVFEHGEITQFGTHTDLIQNEHGKYYELWFAQAKYYIK